MPFVLLHLVCSRNRGQACKGYPESQVLTAS